MNILIDPEDRHLLTKFPWCTDGGYYIYNDGTTTHALHRLIMNAPANLHVDHKEGNLNDLRKQSLRLCTHQQNMFNRKKQSTNCTSKYKGVSFDKTRKHWKVYVAKSGIREY